MLQQVDKMALSIWFMLCQDTGEEKKLKQNWILNGKILSERTRLALNMRTYIQWFEIPIVVSSSPKLDRARGEGRQRCVRKRGKLHRKVLIHYAIFLNSRWIGYGQMWIQNDQKWCGEMNFIPSTTMFKQMSIGGLTFPLYVYPCSILHNISPMLM